MAERHRWTEPELLVAFRLYCRTPFGRLHQRNPEIIQLSQKLGRTPAALAMKACNFASLDPIEKARDVKALVNVSRDDRKLWNRFSDDPDGVAAEAEAAYANLTGESDSYIESDFSLPEGPTEFSRMVRLRRVQTFFREAVLVSYERRCALSDIAIPELLNASHIIPWRADAERRADPRNGIALNVLYDRAFDRGLITFDESMRVVLSRRLMVYSIPSLHRTALIEIEGQQLRLPTRFPPDPAALSYHRSYIFTG
jgi:predicted restriction endonuclease